MAEELEEGIQLLSLNSSLTQTKEALNIEVEQGQSQFKKLQADLMEAKMCVLGSQQNPNKEFEGLRRRVKETATLLANLETKARIIPVSHLNNQEEVDPVGNNSNSLQFASKYGNLISSDIVGEETSIESSNSHGSVERHGSVEHNGYFIREILKSVRMITDLVDVLVKMVIMAETETAIEKEKVNLGQEEIQRKALQIESMSAKVEEMESFALGTTRLLNEMQQKVEDMVQESSRQRLRAAENEQELCRVKQDFQTLRSYVSSLISVRELLLSSEKNQTKEMHLERSIAMAAHLQGENMKKEAEVQKLVAENVRLSALIDKKEAQLVAMNEQCKVMALSAFNV